MDIPDFAQKIIQEITHSIPHKQLELARQQLTQRYRKKESGNHLQDAFAIEAYLATRFPATYSVTHQVFLELQRLMDRPLTGTLLDLGAGPGTTSLAATQIFKQVDHIHLYEINREMITIGKQIFSEGPEVLKQAKWHSGSLLDYDLPRAEISILAYVLNELSPSMGKKFIETLSQRQDRFIVFIEPGTPEGYRRLMEVRSVFLLQSWYVWAPCPHQNACPLAEDDWCHYSSRLPRSSLHRQLKGGSKGYEDEKFAYLILSREAPAESARAARIIRHPGIHKGHIRLNLCRESGLDEQIITKKHAAYKQARKITWGQQWLD